MKLAVTSAMIAALVIVMALAPGPSDSAGSFAPYVMDRSFFSCEIPLDWQLERDPDRDEAYQIYEILLIGPSGDHAASQIYVSYYAKDNEDFIDVNDFISSNSKNVAGETKTKREQYGPVQKTVLNGRNAFSLERERMVYLYPQSKSDESAHIRERLYVLPAGQGFYVLYYSAPKQIYEDHWPVFERVVRSFRPSAGTE